MNFRKNFGATPEKIGNKKNKKNLMEKNLKSILPCIENVVTEKKKA